MSESPILPAPISAQPNTTSTKKKEHITTKRRAVACKSCHSLKVKCIPSDPNDLSSPCVRCIKSKRSCEIDMTHTRKKKKPEDRVTELELRVEKLSHQLKHQSSDDQSPVSVSSEGSRTASFAPNKDFTTFTPQFFKQATSNQRGSTPTQDKNKQYEGGLKFVLENSQFPEESNSNSSHNNTPLQAQPPNKKRKNVLTKEQEIEKMFGPNILTDISNSVTATSESRLRKVQRQSTDIILTGLITLDEAKKRFDIYHKQIYPYYPFVKINSNFEEVRKNELNLFNTVMTITGIVQKPTGKDDINRDIEIEAIALRETLNEFLIVGNKSIELLKCLLLLSIWYNTPELFHHRRYHIISSLCITMVQDLGLTGRPYYVVNKSEGSFRRSAVLEDPQKDEYRCLVLGVYCASIGFSLFLRRRLQVCWSPYMEECYQHLKTSPDSNYRTMAKFAKVSSFLERIHLHVDAKDQDNPALIEYLLFEINTFKNDPEMAIPTNTLMSFISSIEAFLYSKLTSPEYCYKCLQSCSASLNYFGKLTPKEIATCPLLIFGRLMYCFALLLKTTNTLRLEFDFESIKGIMGPLQTCCDTYQKNHMIIKIRLLFYFYLTTFAKNEDAFNNLAEVTSTDAVARTVPMRKEEQPSDKEVSEQQQHLQPIHQQDSSAPGIPNIQQRLSFSLPDSSFLNINQPFTQNIRYNDSINTNNAPQQQQELNGQPAPQYPASYDPQIPELNIEPVYPRLDMLSDATLKGFSELNDFTSPQTDFWKLFDYKDEQFFL